MFNWYQALWIMGLCAGAEGGISQLCAILISLWALLYDIHLGTPIQFGLVLFWTLLFWVLLENANLSVFSGLREILVGGIDVERVTSVVYKLASVHNIALNFLFVTSLKRVVLSQLASLRNERRNLDTIVSLCVCVCGCRSGFSL